MTLEQQAYLHRREAQRHEEDTRNLHAFSASLGNLKDDH